MTVKRKYGPSTSLLDDEELVVIDDRRDQASAGDICERRGCSRPRREHNEDGCEETKCPEFVG